MTQFVFKNEAQIKEFGRECFGKDGKLKEVTKKNLMFLIYLVAYRSYIGQSVNQRTLKYLKEKVKKIQWSRESMIFFEKVEQSSDDFLYFFKVMQELERHPDFKAVYDNMLKEAA